MPSISRPIFDVDFSGLPDASNWPKEYFHAISATTGATATVASGWGILNDGTVGSFGATQLYKLWAWPVEGDKFEALLKVKIISTGNTCWFTLAYRSTDDSSNSCYALVFSDNQYRLDKFSGFVHTTIAGIISQSLAANAVVWVRMRVFGSKHMMRTWPDGTTEPQIWNMSVIDNTNAYIGKIFLSSGASDGSTRSIQFGAIHVKEIGDSYEPILSNYATATFSGNGTITAFTVTHGLDGTPSTVTLTPKSSAASGVHYVSAVTSTTFTVTWIAAPVSGTNNVVIDWRADV